MEGQAGEQEEKRRRKIRPEALAGVGQPEIAVLIQGVRDSIVTSADACVIAGLGTHDRRFQRRRAY